MVGVFFVEGDVFVFGDEFDELLCGAGVGGGSGVCGEEDGIFAGGAGAVVAGRFDGGFESFVAVGEREAVELWSVVGHGGSCEGEVF